MQEINKRKSLTDSELLLSSLWLESVLIQIPAPFGSFEKAKYVMYRYGNSIPLYYFTTTCHNTEECIEIMKGKFFEHRKVEAYCHVYKIQNGIKELIYTDKPIDKP